MTLDIKFSSDDWARITGDWTAWWAGQLDRPMIMNFHYGKPEDVVLADAPHLTVNLPFDMPAQEVIDRYSAPIAYVGFNGDAWPKWFPNFGPGVVSAFLGSELKSAKDTVWFEPVEVDELSQLSVKYTNQNKWYQRIMDLTKTAVNTWQDKRQVALTDLGGNLDILAGLRGTQELLMDLYDCPEEVERLAGEITAAWLRYFDDYYEVFAPQQRGCAGWWPLWAPGKSYMLQCDFSYMISPDMFERFVLPDIKTCCDHLDYGFYHMDGKGQIPHLDLLLSVERLRGIQWIPGDGAEPAEEWPDLLKRIVEAGKLCQIYTSCAGALKIAREVGLRGFAACISDSLSEKQCTDFMADLRRADCGR